jgi:peroxiredoxin
MELLRDRSEEFEAVGVRPLGVSRDSPWTHIAWMQAIDLTFGLLSDWNGEAVRAFGAAQDYRGMKDVPQRAAFLIDRTGEVRAAWSYANDEVPDFDELLRAASAL